MNALVLVGIFIRTWHWPSRLLESAPEHGELRECAICHERSWYKEA